MTKNKKTAGDGVPQAALKTSCKCRFNPNINGLKAAVYRLILWLFIMGMLHV